MFVILCGAIFYVRSDTFPIIIFPVKFNDFNDFSDGRTK